MSSMDSSNGTDILPSEKSDLVTSNPLKQKKSTEAHECVECSKTFSSRPGYTYHMTAVHNVTVESIAKRRLKCAFCDSESFLNYHFYVDHLNQNHRAEIGEEFYTEYKKFNNWDEFWAWKLQIERENVCKFVSRSGFTISGKTARRYYACHRVGPPKFRNNSKEIRKRIGTRKTTYNCPAHMKVEKLLKNGVIRVYYCLRHLGHEQELAHLDLTQEERDKFREILLKCSDGDHESYGKRPVDSVEQIRWLLCTLCGSLVKIPKLNDMINILGHIRRKIHQNAMKKNGVDKLNRLDYFLPVKDPKKYKRTNNDVSMYLSNELAQQDEPPAEPLEDITLAMMRLISSEQPNNTSDTIEVEKKGELPNKESTNENVLENNPANQSPSTSALANQTESSIVLPNQINPQIPPLFSLSNFKLSTAKPDPPDRPAPSISPSIQNILIGNQSEVPTSSNEDSTTDGSDRFQLDLSIFDQSEFDDNINILPIADAQVDPSDSDSATIISNHSSYFDIESSEHNLTEAEDSAGPTNPLSPVPQTSPLPPVPKKIKQPKSRKRKCKEPLDNELTRSIVAKVLAPNSSKSSENKTKPNWELKPMNLQMIQPKEIKDFLNQVQKEELPLKMAKTSKSITKNIDQSDDCILVDSDNDEEGKQPKSTGKPSKRSNIPTKGRYVALTSSDPINVPKVFIGMDNQSVKIVKEGDKLRVVIKSKDKDSITSPDGPSNAKVPRLTTTVEPSETSTGTTSGTVIFNQGFQLKKVDPKLQELQEKLAQARAKEQAELEAIKKTKKRAVKYWAQKWKWKIPEEKTEIVVDDDETEDEDTEMVENSHQPIIETVAYTPTPATPEGFSNIFSPDVDNVVEIGENEEEETVRFASYRTIESHDENENHLEAVDSPTISEFGMDDFASAAADDFADSEPETHTQTGPSLKYSLNAQNQGDLGLWNELKDFLRQNRIPMNRMGKLKNIITKYVDINTPVWR